MSENRKISYLTTIEFARLNYACAPITEAFGRPPYIVGSSVDKNDYRDVDVRSILPDEMFDAIFGQGRLFFWSLFCMGVTEYLTKVTGLPIDYQVQRMTEANEKFDGPRNPIGTRSRPFAGGGDATGMHATLPPHQPKELSDDG